MLNEVRLIGRLGKDPELRYTTSEVAVVEFSLATSERFRSKEGATQERTEWHNIVAWKGLAETCHKFLTKGKLVFVGGRIKTRSYDDRDGNKRYITEIVADQVKFLDKIEDQAWFDDPPQSGDQQQRF